jgi:hypothetical protein
MTPHFVLYAERRHRVQDLVRIVRFVRTFLHKNKDAGECERIGNWGGSAILWIMNRTICLNKREQKLQQVAGAP